MRTIQYEQVNYERASDVRPILTNLVHTYPHWHPEIEIIFVCQGALNLSINGAHNTLQKGSIALINSGEIHSVNSVRDEPGNIFFSLQISGQFMRRLYLDIETARYENFFHPLNGESQTAVNSIRRLLLFIITEFQNQKEDYLLAIHGYCGSVIALLARYFTRKDGGKGRGNSFPGEDSGVTRLKRIFDYIHKNYSKSPSLAEISKAAYVSPYYFSHLFTASAGMTYSQYLNSVKISMVQQDLLACNDNITGIMERHGFDNVKTFNRVFLHLTGCSPSKYRKLMRNSAHVSPPYFTSGPDTNVGNYLNFQSDIRFPDELYREYREIPDYEISESQPFHIRQQKEILVSPASASRPLLDISFFKKMTSVARASDLLRSPVREHIKAAQGEIGFEYIRFHGIFNDEMGLLDPGGDGSYYNFTYIDEIFDFLLQNRLKPFVELSFMPTALASGKETIFFYRGNVSPPRDYSLWEKLVGAFIAHLIQRYSAEEVSRWYFEIWNEPNLRGFWTGTFEDYMELYRRSAVAIKAADGRIPVGGPAVGSLQYSNACSFLEDFLRRCKAEQLPLDFISAHPYPAQYFGEGENRREVLENPLSTRRDIERLHETARRFGFEGKELHCDEWNVSCVSSNLVLDTAFMAPFLLSNYLDCQGLVSSLCYWALSDLFEEGQVPSRQFHGGFGLINKSGLPKPQYHALRCLVRLGEAVLDQGEDYIVTSGKQGSIQILLWNYAHFNDEFALGNREELVFFDRYRIFEKKEPSCFHIRIPNPSAKTYLIEKTIFDREHGSGFDLWLKNGALEYPSPRQLAILKDCCEPLREILVMENRSEIRLEETVEPFGFVLLEINAM